VKEQARRACPPAVVPARRGASPSSAATRVFRATVCSILVIVGTLQRSLCAASYGVLDVVAVVANGGRRESVIFPAVFRWTELFERTTGLVCG